MLRISDGCYTEYIDLGAQKGLPEEWEPWVKPAESGEESGEETFVWEDTTTSDGSFLWAARTHFNLLRHSDVSFDGLEKTEPDFWQHLGSSMWYWVKYDTVGRISSELRAFLRNNLIDRDLDASVVYQRILLFEPHMEMHEFLVEFYEFYHPRDLDEYKETHVIFWLGHVDFTVQFAHDFMKWLDTDCHGYTDAEDLLKGYEIEDTVRLRFLNLAETLMEHNTDEIESIMCLLKTCLEKNLLQFEDVWMAVSKGLVQCKKDSSYHSFY